MRRIRVLCLCVGTMALLAGVSAAEPAAGVPTFTKDVAPILFDNCVLCHRDGEVAPMSLVTYAETRPWSRAIKEKVVTREMPPWHADPRFGEFRNARGLTQKQIDTVVAWVDGGAPKGEDADLPAPPEFADGWVHGEPDYVLEQPVEYQVAAEGEVEYLDWFTRVPFEEDVFIEGVEMRPGNRAAVHHSGAYMVSLPEGTILRDGKAYAPDGEPLDRDLVKSGGVTQGTNKLVSYVPGRGYESYGRGAAKRISAGEYIRWDMHYNSTGKPEADRSKLGFYFYDGEPTHEVMNGLRGMGPTTYLVQGQELRRTDRGAGKGLPVIPPHEGDWEIVSVTAVQNDTTIHGLSPHLHLRGKAMTYIATYPDGRTETLLSVPNYDFNWQHYYDFAEVKQLPAGSKLTVVTLFDNSVRNRYNPAPDKEVYWGEQSWDEMYSPQVRITVDKYDLTVGRKPTSDQE